jgi:predicted HTH domain antitoxin
MNVTVSIPDEFAGSLGEQPDLSRQMLEAFAIESYRAENLSLGQVAELLGFSIDETNAFLKKHRVPLNYTLDDFERDEQTVEMFLKK